MAASASLMLHLTGRCNLRCQHCYMNGSPNRQEQLPFEWIVETLGIAPSLGISTLFLTGGEPLLYPQFIDIARIASSIEGVSTTVCTNATLIRQHHANLFASLGLNVHVSIDGGSDYHDSFRNSEGAFQQAVNGIRLLIEAGVPVTIVTTVTQKNFNQFLQIADWAKNVGAQRLLVQPLLNLGRGSSIQQQQLTSEQLNILIYQTSDFAHSSKGQITASIIGFNKQFLLAHPCAAYICNGNKCHRHVSAEIKKVIVREDGTILPEATNLDHRYAIGKVTDGSLKELIENYFSNGYQKFERLCRSTYEEFVPNWPDAIIPWNQLLAERSQVDLPTNTHTVTKHTCTEKIA